MAKNCRLLIADYFESLRFELDIYTEESLKKAKDQGTLLENVKFDIPNKSDEKDISRDVWQDNYMRLLYKNVTNMDLTYITDPFSSEYKYDNNTTNNQISPNLTVEDYFNKTRSQVIAELKILEKEALEYYASNSTQFPVNIEKYDKEQINELKSQLFANKFCFLLNFENFNKKDTQSFKLTTIVLDFYLDTYYIEDLKYKCLQYRNFRHDFIRDPFTNQVDVSNEVYIIIILDKNTC
jgi:hypothetical protein